MSGLLGFTNVAILAAPGISSFRSSICFPTNSLPMNVTPVTFAPGRLRLPTSPLATGSSAVVNTMGTVFVAVTTSRTPAVAPPVTMTATLRRMRSAANSRILSILPSAQR